MLTRLTDWNLYRQIFPSRYFREGVFDAITSVAAATRKPAPCKALEIGCGVSPCKAMTLCLYYGIETYFLDKYVETTPDVRIDWDTNLSFDLVFMRGSINYLDESELRRVSELLAPGGLLFANSFLKPPPAQFRERTEVTGDGEEIVERSRLIDQHVVLHQVVFRDSIYEHFFYFRTLDEFSDLLGEGCSFTPYGRGSVLIMKQR